MNVAQRSPARSGPADGAHEGVAGPRLSAVEFAAALVSNHVEPEQLRVDDKGTLCTASRSDATVRGPLTTLVSESDPEIVYLGTIAQGAMGEVLLARQSSLGREVAVKVARRDGANHDAGLVAEARVAGQLEHPNIVPVHILGMDQGKRPILVMKRVEGDSWRDLLKRGRDLDRDIAILMAVCQALHFAHSHGVAHCDVKPANVMVGRFGEVYLVDWGVAVGFGAVPLPEVPHARTVKGVFGTPKYLAPEMALPTGAIDQRSDVFIVGAILYELIAGRSLRLGKKIRDLLHEAHLAPPPVFAEDVDEELASICTTALAREPAARFATVDDLRLSLMQYQQRGAARTLVREADARLRQLMARGQASPPATVDDVEDIAIRRLFTECRFGFQMALSSWPSSTRARDGLRDALSWMAGHELQRGNLASARALTAELSTPPTALLEGLQRLEAAEAARLDEVNALQRFVREHDLRFAERERAVFVFGSAVAWLLLMVALDVAAWRGIFVAGPGVFSAFMASFAAVIALGGILVPSLRATAASRALLITMFCCVAGLATLHGTGFLLGLGAGTMLAFGHILLAVTAGQLAADDPRLWPATVAATIAVVAIVLWPERAVTISGLAGFVMLTDIAWRWRQSPSSLSSS
jgi:hypothetical protein